MIIPLKLVIDFDKKEEVRNAVLLYKKKVDGVVLRQPFTISVKGGINIKSLNSIIKASIAQANKSEDMGLRDFQMQHKVKEER